MALPDPRRLAAADMYGTAGTPRRRQLVRAEFIAGACGCTALGILILAAANDGWIGLGIWLIGIGANYIALAVEARRLSPPGVLDAEMTGREPRLELRRAARTQLWIVVPFAISAVGVVSTRRH
jgi:hypothetical protein